jgi:arginine utilization protein RocB
VHEVPVDEEQRRIYDEVHVFIYGGKAEDADENWKRYFQMLCGTEQPTDEPWWKATQQRPQEMTEKELKVQEYKKKEGRKRKEAAARATRREAEEIAAEKARNEARDKEAKRQEKRWDQTQTCLHSSFCETVRHQRKIKCDACHQRRGIMAFKCPYCPCSLCQKCVGEFAARRMREQELEVGNYADK